MTILAQFLRLRSSMILFIIAAGLISRPTLAQVHFADQVVCSSGVVDYEDAGWNNGGYSIDVEQSACISYSDGDGFDSWVETDDDYGEVFYDEYWSYNQYVTGVGAEAQMSYLDPNNGNSIVVSDSGMIYANSLGTAYAPASYTGQPQFTGYVLQGYYSEENLQGVWSDVAYGISLEMGMLLIPNITVSTSGTPSAVGQPVTFTATVNNTSGPAPTGDIYFEIIRQSSPGWNSGDSTGTISGTTATYTTNALPVGTYDIFIYYSGDSNYVYGQVGNYFYQVVSASLTAPTLSLTTSSASSTAGHPVMFTANISSGATGVLNFLVDGTVIGSRTITSNSATFTTSALTLGTHSISANYSGNQNYSAVSSNTLTQVVTYALQPSGTTDYSYTITPTGGPSGYSSNGNLLSYTDSVNGTWSNIAYDGLNRLSAATQVPVGGVAQSYCWTYDSFGNRTTQATSNQPFVNAPGAATCQVASGATLTGNAWTSYTVNGADQGNNRVVATSAGSYQPDAAGNILSDGVNGYTYDGEGRLCAVAVPQYTGGVILTQYIYDAAGTRVAKGANTNLNAGCDTSGTTFTLTNTYVIGPSGEQLTETDGNGNWLHTNVFGAGKLLATYSYTDYTHTTTDTYFALSDWLGTKRAVVSAGGCGTGYVSLPYGDSLTPSNLPGFTQCPDATENHFTGKERDAESGNDYFGARYYASSMGRFLSPDWSAQAEPVPYAKLDNPQSLNLYSYMYNSPLGGVDADGHWPGWLDNGVADTRQWAAEHPRTMEAAAAVATGVATVGAVALIVATAPVSVPATLGAAAITALTTTTAVIGATGGAVATVTLAAGAISGDVKGTSAAATAVGTVTNPVGMAVALGTGGNMQAAGTAATATSLVTGLQSAATGANALIQAGGAASAASAASGLAPAPTPAPARTPAPTPCSTDTSQCH